jgi:hypothetical protein
MPPQIGDRIDAGRRQPTDVELDLHEARVGVTH